VVLCIWFWGRAVGLGVCLGASKMVLRWLLEVYKMAATGGFPVKTGRTPWWFGLNSGSILQWLGLNLAAYYSG